MPLSQQDFMELNELINPLNHCQDYGIQLYTECVDFVSALFMVSSIIITKQCSDSDQSGSMAKG